MRVFQDEVEVGILPDTARCKLACKCPFDIEECPDGNEFCSGNCYYYTEDSEEAAVLDRMDRCFHCDDACDIENCKECSLNKEI